MLRMDQVHVVRHKVLVEGLSQRSVADELGISRNTVARYLGISEPVRVETKPRARPVMDHVAARIDQLLEEWRPRTTRKQRITAPRLVRQLREEGFEVGTTTVKAYLREKRRQEAEVYIPLIYRAGECAQVDFFEVTVEEGGVVRKAWKFLLRLMHSGHDFVWLYDQCNQEAFFDGHIRAFAYLGGVPARLIYDNLTPAVKRIVGSERDLNDRFLALVSHYLFEPCFARPGEGHDKGGVESRGKNIRLQHMVPIPRGATLAQIAEALLDDVRARAATTTDDQGRTTLERFEQERSALSPLPPEPFEARRLRMVSISSKSTVQIDGEPYSLPCSWARLHANAYVGVDDVRFVCRGEVQVRSKPRPGQSGIRYRDYLPELARKPQAVRQVAPELLEELGPPWGRLWQLLVDTHGEREAARVLARVLAAVVKHGEAHVRGELEAALAEGATNLLALRAWFQDAESTSSVPVPETLSAYEIEAADATGYDFLLEGGVR